MASVSRHGKRWRAQVAIKGKRKSKVFDTRNEATLWAIEAETVLKGGKATVGGYTLREAFKRYAEEISPTKRGERWEVLRLNKLCRDRISYIPVDRLENQDVQDWIDRQTISAGSVLRELNLIQSVVKQCRRWRWTNLELTDLRKPRQPKHRERLITPQEIKLLLAHSTLKNRNSKISTADQVLIAFQLALETAMRKGEILGLTWDNVYLDRHYVHLPITKNGKGRDVPLSNKAVKLLKQMNPSRGKVFSVSDGTFNQSFSDLRKKAGVSGFVFHDTRHTAITRLASKLSVLELARMVGHSDPKTLMVYYNESAEKLAAKLD